MAESRAKMILSCCESELAALSDQNWWDICTHRSYTSCMQHHHVPTLGMEEVQLHYVRQE